jgi:hypothetical protein
VPNILISVPTKKVKQPLSETHPELAKEADGWDPTKITFGSNLKLGWTCARKHSWKSKVSHRASGIGCPFCYGRYPIIGETDFASTHPDLAKEIVDADPTTFSFASHSSIEWKCALGHIWRATVKNRAGSNKSGCPFCANQVVLPGFNDLETLYPELAKQVLDADPSKITAKSGKRLEWVCELGHIWKTSPGHRVNGSNCPVCSGRTVWRGFNDLATVHPDVAVEADGWDPTSIVAGHHGKKSWKCKEGHRWKAAVSSRTSGGNGCPSCSTYGFNPSKDGFLYFLYNSNWEMFQIGITNVPDARLGRHERKGWITLEVRGPMDGHLTQQWETAILRMLRGRGADLSNDKIAGKFDGYSEAWSKSTFEAKSIKELMRLTEEFEKND